MRTSRRINAMLLTALLALSAVQCVQDYVSGPPRAAYQFSLTPDTSNLAIGDDFAVPFTGALTLDGRAIGYQLVLSADSVSSFITIDSLGRVRVTGRGLARLRARAFGPQLVEPVPETTVVVRGVVPRIGLVTVRTVDTLSSLGEQQFLFAAALTNGGDTIPGVPIHWRFTGGGGAILGLDTTTGRVTALANGLALLEAHVDAVTASRTVVVRQRASSLVATDTVVLHALGQTRSLAGQLSDARGVAMVGQAPTWHTLDAAVATISPAGLATAASAGAALAVGVYGNAPGDSVRDTTLVLVVPSRLRADSGLGQVATVGTTLAPFVAQLVDSTGAVVRDSGIAVRFSLPTGGGTFVGGDTAITVPTDTAGRASARLALGNVARTVVAQASGTGLTGAAVVFTAQAQPGVPQSFVVDSGNNQTGTVGAALAPFVVRVVDQFGNGVALQGVAFRRTVGQGTLAGSGTFTGPDSVVTQTDSLGRARAVLTLGTVAGANAVQVSATVGTPLTFTATGAPGAPVVLEYIVQPTGTTSGSAITPAMQVMLRDVFGNRVTAATNTVSLTVLGGTPGTGLVGNPSVAASAGLAVFANVALDHAGSGFRLIATAAGLTPDTSVTFNVSAGAADHVGFTVQPSNGTAGTANSPAIVVTIMDALGNRVETAANLVSLTLATVPVPGATVFGTVQVPAVNGIAVFNDVRFNKATPGYQLAAGASEVAISATSTFFTIAAGVPKRLERISQAGQNGVTGQPLAEPFVIAVRDTFDNLVVGDTVQYSVVSGGGSFGGASFTRVATTSQGQAAALLTLGGAGTTVIEARSLRLADSVVTFTASATPAGLHLTFTVQPSNATGGTAMAPQVRVEVRDGSNVLQNVSTIVTLAITSGTGTPGAALGGTFQAQAVNGVVVFPNLSVDRAGTGYTLTATATGVTSDVSTPFNITVGPAVRLGFAAPLGNGVAGAPLGGVAVQVQDAGGNTVPGATNAVTVAIAGGTGTSGATLRGTTTVNAVNGVATFTTLSIDSVGAGYRLQASSAPLAGALSSAFNIGAAPASRLVFTVQPTTTVAGVVIAPNVRVAVRDSLGNAVASSATITLALTSGVTPVSGGVANAVSGEATFSAASVQRAGTGYTFTASSPGLTSAVSGAFTITPGTASRLSFTVEPTSALAGQAIAPAVQVGVHDVFGNVVPTSTASVTVAILPGTGSAGAALSGTTTVAAASGIASFGTLSINRVGAGYRFSAGAAGLGPDTSQTFSIAAAAAESLVVVSGNAQNAPVGATLGQPFVVAVRDHFGNAIAGHAVTFKVTAGGGNFGGPDSVQVLTNAAGLASTTLTLGPGETANTAEARSTGLVGTPRVFTATPVPSGAQLAFTVEPSSAVAGATIAPQIQVAVQSAGGSTITTASSVITLAITAGSGTANAHLIGTQAVAAVSGVATFQLGVDSVGSGYTLTATASGLTSDVSAPFAITPGTPARVRFVTQPSNTAFGSTITPAVRVAVLDAQGNVVPSSSAPVTVAITAGTGTAGAVLGGTLTAAAAAGVATFGNLTVDLDGAAYTLTATSAGLTAATSAPFNRFGGPARLVFTTEPVGVTAGATFTPAVQVTIVDAIGNPVTSATDAVTLAIRSGTGAVGATLAGTLTVAPVNGVASFSNLSIASAAAGYQLVATAAGLVADTTAPFTVAPGAPVRLDITVEPTSRTAGSPITPAVQVTVRDALGNVAGGAPTDITVLVLPGSGAPGATLAGTTTITAPDGVATFPDLNIDRAATGYRLVVTAAGIAPDTSGGFAITVGPLASVVFTQSAGSLASFGATTQFVAEGRDASGNVVSGLTFTWGSTDPAVATVSAAGLVTAVANGPTTISATANGISASLPVLVAQVTSSVVVTPPSYTIGAIGSQRAFGAVALDALGSPIAGKVFGWSSNAAGVATIDPVTGVATAAGNGAATITATVDGVNGTATLTVQQVIASITVGPSTSNLASFGQQVQLTAVARDSNANVISAPALTWAPANGSIASVTTAGLVTALGNGSTLVTATAANSVAGSATVNVAQVTASVVVTPGSAAFGAFGGAGRSFTAQARDANGNAIAGKTFAWASTATGVAQVSPASGASTTVTAQSNGSATISATVDGQTGTAPVTVTQLAASVLLTPGNPATLATINRTQQFTVVARDSNNNVIAAPTITFTSLNTTVATITLGGLATARANGTSQIIAAVNARADTSVLTVQQIIRTVTITPASQTIPGGGSRNFSAAAFDTLGTAVPGITFNWTSSESNPSVTSSNPSVTATVGRTCVLIFCGGSATITATSVGGGPGGANIAGTATAN